MAQSLMHMKRNLGFASTDTIRANMAIKRVTDIFIVAVFVLLGRMG